MTWFTFSHIQYHEIDIQYRTQINRQKWVVRCGYHSEGAAITVYGQRRILPCIRVYRPGAPL